MYVPLKILGNDQCRASAPAVEGRLRRFVRRVRCEVESESGSVSLQVGTAERRVVVVVNEQRHIAQAQRLSASGKRHQDDGHEHRQQNEQLVAPEQHEFLPGLSHDFLHSGISDLRDSMSEIKTSSSENGTPFALAAETPDARSTVTA